MKKRVKKIIYKKLTKLKGFNELDYNEFTSTYNFLIEATKENTVELLKLNKRFKVLFQCVFSEDNILEFKVIL